MLLLVVVSAALSLIPFGRAVCGVTLIAISAPVWITTLHLPLSQS